MIRFAEACMLPDLKALWHEAFGDDDAYIDLFYTHRFVPEQTLVWAEHGKPLAMITLLPAHLNTRRGVLAARYIYGVATKQKHRGRGISTALLKHAADLARQSGELLMLVPSGEGLFAFYRERGFKPFFYLSELIFPCTGDAQPQTLEPVSPAGYKILRDLHLDAPGYVSWDERAVAYAMRENAHLGGQTLALSYGGARHAVMLFKQGKTLRVRETTLPSGALWPALGALAQDLGCDTIHASLPYSESAAPKPFGMLYEDARVEETNGYLNLALD